MSQKIITKHPLKWGKNELVFPLTVEYRYFHIHPVSGELCMWVSHPPVSVGNIMQLLKVNVIPDGETFESSEWSAVATAIDSVGRAWHLLMEKKPDTVLPQYNNNTQSWRHHAN